MILQTLSHNLHWNVSLKMEEHLENMDKCNIIMYHCKNWLILLGNCREALFICDQPQNIVSVISAKEIDECFHLELYLLNHL